MTEKKRDYRNELDNPSDKQTAWVTTMGNWEGRSIIDTSWVYEVLDTLDGKNERIKQIEHALKLLQATYKEMLKEIDMLRELVKSADPERVLPNKEITNNTSE